MAERTSEVRLAVAGVVLALSAAAILTAWSTGSWSRRDATPTLAVTRPATHGSHGVEPPVGVAWADDVLAAAAVPPGARVTADPVPTLRAPGQSLSGHQVDVHRLYLVPGTRATVAAYLLRHLPRGASANQGDEIQTDPVPYDAEFIPVTMPAAGPNEDAATLLYAFAADGPGLQEPRIDAETVSVPDRTAASKAAPTGRVVVTGYGESSLSGGTSDPVSVTISGAPAAAIRSAFDRLGLSQPPACMEYLASFELQFFDAGARSPALSATGSFSRAIRSPFPGVAEQRRPCPIHTVRSSAAVVRSLPAGTGSATRGVLRSCRMIYVG